MIFRRILALSTFASAAAFSSYAYADEYDFSFVSTAADPFSGSGYFYVDTSGVSPGFSGTLQASFIYFTFTGGGGGTQQYGTNFGTVVYNYDTSPPYTTTISHPGSSPAQVEFSNGLAVGVLYSESHTCTGPYHCEPAEIVELAGNKYDAFAYPVGSLGVFAPLTIAAAVPEPSALALMIPGMLLLGWRARKRT